MWKLGIAMVGAIAAALVSWAGSVPIWAWFVLVIFGIGGGLFISNEWASARLRKHGSVPTQKGDQRQTGESPWVRYFDRLFRFEINQVYLRGLWKDDISQGVWDNPEPFVRFQIVIYNNTDLHLKVVGLRGSTTVDGDACTLAAVIEPPEVDLPPWNYQTPTIKQPLLGGRGEDLINATRTSRSVRISLGSVQLLVEGDGLPQRPVAIGLYFELLSLRLVQPC